MKKFIVSEYSFEYNDEGYDKSEGGIPVGIFDTMEDAEVFMKKATLRKVESDPGTVVSESHISGNHVDEFIAIFGSDGVDVKTDRWQNKYAYIYFDDINTSEWDDEKTKKFIEFFDIETHFITELEV